MLTLFLILMSLRKIINKAKNSSINTKQKSPNLKNKFMKLQEVQRQERTQQSLLEDQFQEKKSHKEVTCQT